MSKNRPVFHMHQSKAEPYTLVIPETEQALNSFQDLLTKGR